MRLGYPPKKPKVTPKVAILRAFPVASRATGHGIRLSAAGHGIPMTWSMSFGTLTERCLPGSRATPVVIG
jgi:hypothetical protein